MATLDSVDLYMGLSSARSGWNVVVSIYAFANYSISPDTGSLLGTKAIDVSNVPLVGDGADWVNFTFDTPIDISIEAGWIGVHVTTTAPDQFARTPLRWYESSEFEIPDNPPYTGTEKYWYYDSSWVQLEILGNAYKLNTTDCDSNDALTPNASYRSFGAFAQQGIRSYLNTTAPSVSVIIRSVKLGANGAFIVVAAKDGVYLSTDSGTTWSRKTPDAVEDTDWEKGICNSDGTYIIVVSNAGAIYRSANSGSSWAAITPAGGDTFSVNKMATSDDGQFMVIVGQNLTDATESCYISTDYGATWTAKKPIAASIEYTECDISNDGTVIAVSTSTYFYISFDTGTTWKEQGMAASAEVWKGLSISGDGTTGLVANTNNNDEFFIGINTELFSKATWAESTITSVGRTLLGDATVADQNTTLGFGTGSSPTLTGLTLSGLAETRVVFAGEDGLLTDDADFTFADSTLSATNFTATGLGTFGEVKVDNITINDGTISTSTRSLILSSPQAILISSSFNIMTFSSQGDMNFNSDSNIMFNLDGIVDINSAVDISETLTVDGISRLDGKVGVGINPTIDFHAEYSSSSGNPDLFPAVRLSNTNIVGLSFAAFSLQGANGATWLQLLADGSGAFRGGTPNSYFRVITNTPILFGTNSTVRGTIEANGYYRIFNRLMIGSDADPTAFLTVIGDAAIGDGTNKTVIGATGNITQAGSADATLNLTTSSTQTEWDSAYDNMVTAITFNAGDGIITITQQDSGTLTTDSLDGRYYTETELGSTDNALGASLIGVEDAMSIFTATDVEAALEEIMDKVTPVTYLANAIATTQGTPTGDVTDTQTINDGNEYLVDEATGTPGFITTVTFTGIVVGHEANKIQAHYSYDGNHTITLQIEKAPFDDSAWDNVTTITNTSGTLTWLSIDIPGIITDYYNSGTTKIRWNHIGAGNINHDFILDYAAIKDDTSGGGGITDHGGMSGLQDDDHDPLYHTDGRAATWLAANHETTFIHADIATNTAHSGTTHDYNYISGNDGATDVTGAELEALTDNSIADALHRHSELVASDGSPDPALSVDASGNISMGIASANLQATTGLQIHGVTSEIHLTSVSGGSATSDGSILLQFSDDNFYIFNRENASIIFGTNGTQKMVLNANGNLGISNTAPESRVSIFGNMQLSSGAVGFNRVPSTGALPSDGNAGMGRFQVTPTTNYLALESYNSSGTGTGFLVILAANGDVGINDISPSFKLDVTGTGRFTGKLTSLGVVDPPGVLYDSETRVSTVARVKREVPKDKLSGCFMFYNGESGNMELYFPITGVFKNFNGELIDQVEQITETYATVDKYHLDELTGEVIKTQVEAPENKKYKAKKGYKLDSKTGKFFNDKNKEVAKAEAVEYVNKVKPSPI